MALPLICNILAPGAQASFELVQTAPLETTLEVAEIRSTHVVWREMLQKATRSIDIEQFYIDSLPNEPMAAILDDIATAARRGIPVRVIVDSKFLKTYSQIPAELSKLPNVKVRIADYSKAGGIQHAKFFIVDGQEVYFGSANFDWRALKHIHEIGLRTTESRMAQDMNKIFELDWRQGTPMIPRQWNLTLMDSLRDQLQSFISSKGHRQETKGGLIPVASPASRNPSNIQPTLPKIVELMKSARKSIKIQVYEYSTRVYGTQDRWYVLDSEIRSRAASGIHVQLLVDAVSLKSGREDLRALAATPNIEVKTVKIPGFSEGHIDYARLVHSKYMVIDEAKSAWIGTENWSGSYFTGSRNVGAALQSPEYSIGIDQLNQIFERVWSSSYAQSVI